MSDDLREAFEDAVYQQAFVSSTRVVQVQPGESRLLADCPTKAEVCRRGEDGHYAIPTVDSAWWAWQQAHARGVAEERARVVAAWEFSEIGQIDGELIERLKKATHT